MENVNRTGGIDNAAAVSAVARMRMQRIAEEAAKYRLPGMALGQGPVQPGEKAPLPPMNLVQLKTWVQHEGGIDLYA